MTKTKKILLAVAGVLVAAVLLAGGFYFSKLSLLDYDTSSDPFHGDISTPLDDEGIDLSNQPYIEDASGNMMLPEGDVFADEDVFNILLIGTDERSKEFSENARSDSMMLLSLNKKTHAVKLVSLERGLGVPVPGRNDDWLTHVFRYGGADLLMQTVRDCFKVDVDRYVRVNFYTFEQIINSIGGVDIQLTELECKGLNNEAYTYGKTKHQVTPGWNHLDGYDALQYARLRFIDSDWQRIQRQRTVVQAAVNQTKEMSLSDLNKFANEVLPLVRTNLTKGEITSLLFAAPGFMGVQMEQMTIPAEGTHWGRIGVDGRSLIACDFEANAKILQEFFYGEEASSDRS